VGGLGEGEGGDVGSGGGTGGINPFSVVVKPYIKMCVTGKRAATKKVLLLDHTHSVVHVPLHAQEREDSPPPPAHGTHYVRYTTEHPTAGSTQFCVPFKCQH
jgi:hypothetical protein